MSRISAILRALENQPVGLSLGQIAKATGLPRATVHRIVDALEVEQFVAPDTVNGGVRLGAAVTRLAASAFTDFKSTARPHLESLSRRVQETIVLTALAHGRLTYIDQVLPDRPLQIAINPMVEIDPYFSATGKAHLAALPSDELEAWLPKRLEPMTPKSVTHVETLRAQIAEARRSGIAIDDEELATGSCAIATTVQASDQTIYALTLITTAARFEAGVESFRRELETTREDIKHSLGHR